MSKHNSKNQFISNIINAVPSGILLCIGCAVSMSVESKALGAFLFSLGLFLIIRFKLGLYTGKAGYISTNPPSYLIEVGLTIIGNIIGTALGGTLLYFTRFGVSFSEKASAVMASKMSDSPVSMFILAVFCGILMYSAVEGSKRASQNRDFISGLFAVVMPVMVFILCGFNHCVADMSYFFISGCHNPESAPLYFTAVILGNALGCNLIPLFARLSKYTSH
ncbi:MAG: formate/nitrite transporter family protein [bacterium]|nr:formate/nitrite transporter family protein [bacterium]